jgi:hypothetical protein
VNQLEYNFEATSPQTKLSTINTKISATGGNNNSNTIYGNTQKHLHTHKTSKENDNNVVFEKNIYNGYYTSTNKYASITDNNLQEKILQKDKFNKSKMYEKKQNRSFMY